MMTANDTEKALRKAYEYLADLENEVRVNRDVLQMVLDRLVGEGVVEEHVVVDLQTTVRTIIATPGVHLHPWVDKYRLKPDDQPNINCASHLDVCQAICCSLDFRLTLQDLDEGVVKWDLERPFIIRSGSIPCGGERYCYHLRHNKQCAIYEYRPATCRWMDCRDDKRIWADYDKREPGYMLQAALEKSHG